MPDQLVYPRSFVDTLPAYDGRRRNALTVALTKREDQWAVRRRARIEEWYAAIGGEDAKLLRRLRDTNDVEAAEFELFVYATLRSRGLDVVWSPEIENQNPDLGAELAGRFSIIEVLTREEPPELRRRNRRLDAFRVALSDSGGISLMLYEEIPDSIPDHDLAALGARVAASLVAPASGALEGPKLDLSAFGLRGKASRLALKITLSSGPVVCGDDIDALRVRLVEKAKKYKWLMKQRTPYVVVVCRGMGSLVRCDSVEQALLGREVIRVEVGPGGPTGEIGSARRIDGVVRPATTATGRPRYSRISAVVYCERDDADDETLCRLAVFHNPYARNPLRQGAFAGFPELTWRIEDSGYVGEWIGDPDTWFVI